MWTDLVNTFITAYYAYASSVIDKVIWVAAFQVNLEINATYVIDPFAETVTPSPDEDYDFIFLVGLKCLVIIANGEFKDAALNNISISDGPASVNLTGRTKELAAFHKKMEEEYARAKVDYGLNKVAYRTAVLTPTTYSALRGDIF